MEFNPHEYQRRAIAWVVDHPRCALFLDMGLGKTVSTLTAVARLMAYGEVTRTLVIAPKKVAETTWSDECAKWDHLRHLRVSVIAGNPKKRADALHADADIYVIGRDSTVWLQETLGKDTPFDMAVLDELTSFKNPRASRSKALRRILPAVPRVVGLTGTPSPNGLLDLFGQMLCIDRGERLGRFITHYRERWFSPVMHNNIIIKCPPKPGAEAEIMDAIGDITLAMRAEDWLNLPEMIIADVPVTLPDAKMRAYRRFERDCVLTLTEEKEDGTRQLTADGAASLINKLAQFADGAVYDEGHAVVPVHDEKLEALSEIIEAEDTPLLVFYQYQHDRDRILARFGKTMRARVYEGADTLRAWNSGKIDLLLAHPASTAFGLNMQAGGSRIAWFSTGWNLELYQQANARLHRQGQTRAVRVFNLVARGTVDERMAAALRGKADTQAGVLRRLARDVVNACG